MNETKPVKRFGLMFRIQHIILFVTVIVAIITGIPMKYPDAWLSRLTVMLMGGVEMRAHLHHWAGMTMVLLGLFHLSYYVFIDRRIPFYKRPVLFQIKDFKDLLQHQQFNLGLNDRMPRMGRYTWFEKFDYIGVIWGIGVMGLTGVPMLYMDWALQWIPLSWLQTLWAAHSEEAMLATLFLIVIHMYHVHFSPEKFPMSLTWWDGLISREEMEKYHPLELEEMEAAKAAAEIPKEKTPESPEKPDKPPPPKPARKETPHGLTEK